MANSNSLKNNSIPKKIHIFSGKWRGSIIPVINVPGIRPTPARIRETLFNWLRSDIVGARCLDLFAGTGALGFEALSRGAKSVCFVDKNRKAVKAINQVARKFGFLRPNVLVSDAFLYLENNKNSEFDIIFLDPPFSAVYMTDLFKLLSEYCYLADGAFIYVEQNKADKLPLFNSNWDIIKKEVAGNVRYMLFRYTKGGNRS
tara:strand:- start:219 stop:824 length:606 start_codon:yes stop_codon:yes gene_type:complete